MTGPVNVKQISTLNVKSGRPGKCENNSTLNVKKVWSVASSVSLDNLVGLVSFFGIFGVRGVNIPEVKNPGKCHDLERKCKMLIQEWAGGIFLGF